MEEEEEEKRAVAKGDYLVNIQYHLQLFASGLYSLQERVLANLSLVIKKESTRTVTTVSVFRF